MLFEVYYYEDLIGVSSTIEDAYELMLDHALEIDHQPTNNTTYLIRETEGTLQ